ncbi:MAG: ABC transporter ATP-binding protein [Pseudomonadota bacterium]
MSLIQLKQLKKTYHEGNREHTVFDGIELEIAKGEFVVMLGQSGSGKSTILNLVSGIDLPDSGEVIIDGKSINNLTDKERTLFRRRHIGFVFQFFNLVPTLTVEENLYMPLTLNGVTGEPAKQRVTESLEQVGLQERLHSFPDNLSGGEQQRISIARALIHKPMLLLADEPTGNLDQNNSERVLALLMGLVKRNQTTMLMVTHNSEISQLADRQLVMHQGEMLEQN